MKCIRYATPCQYCMGQRENLDALDDQWSSDLRQPKLSFELLSTLSIAVKVKLPVPGCRDRV